VSTDIHRTDQAELESALFEINRRAGELETKLQAAGKPVPKRPNYKFDYGTDLIVGADLMPGHVALLEALVSAPAAPAAPAKVAVNSKYSGATAKLLAAEGCATLEELKAKRASQPQVNGRARPKGKS